MCLIVFHCIILILFALNRLIKGSLIFFLSLHSTPVFSFSVLPFALCTFSFFIYIISFLQSLSLLLRSSLILGILWILLSCRIFVFRCFSLAQALNRRTTQRTISPWTIGLLLFHTFISLRLEIVIIYESFNFALGALISLEL